MNKTLALVAALGLIATPVFANEAAVKADAKADKVVAADAKEAKAEATDAAKEAAPAAGEAKHDTKHDAAKH